MLVHIPVPVAELFDKISILEIKLEEIQDAIRRAHVRDELKKIMHVVHEKNMSHFIDNELYKNLKAVNKEIWDVCEVRRQCESTKNFGVEFVEQSRREYLSNDRRAEIKRQINLFFESEIIEVKSYKNFSAA